MIGCGAPRAFPGTGASSVADLADPEAEQMTPHGTTDDPSPFRGGPFPAEFGNLPQLPLQSLPPSPFFWIPPFVEAPIPFGNYETPPLSREP